MPIEAIAGLVIAAVTAVIAFVTWLANPRVRMRVEYGRRPPEGQGPETLILQAVVRSRTDLEIQGFTLSAPRVSKQMPLEFTDSEVRGESLPYRMQAESTRIWELDVTRVGKEWWDTYATREEHYYPTFFRTQLFFRVILNAGAGVRKRSRPLQMLRLISNLEPGEEIAHRSWRAPERSLLPRQSNPAAMPPTGGQPLESTQEVAGSD
jgi:hypothetical protein